MKTYKVSVVRKLEYVDGEIEADDDSQAIDIACSAFDEAEVRDLAEISEEIEVLQVSDDDEEAGAE